MKTETTPQSVIPKTPASERIIRLSRKAWESRAARCLLRGALGYFLAQNIIWGGDATIFVFAPFGVALVAASGGGLEGLSALLGVAAGGYRLGGTLGSSVVAAALLVFMTLRLLKDVRYAARPWFPPLVAGVVRGLMAAVLLLANSGLMAGSGNGTHRWLLLACELTLLCGCVYYYRLALSAESIKSTIKPTVPAGHIHTSIGFLILLATAVSAIHSVGVGGFSLGRIVAGTFVLLLAARGGGGVGAAAGVVVGAVLDLSLGRPFFCTFYGLSALLTGVLAGGGRVFGAAAFLAGTAVCLFWSPFDTALHLMVECALAAGIFLLIPESALPGLTAHIPGESIFRGHTHHASRLRTQARRRLSQTAEVFRELYDTVGHMVEKPIEDDGSASLFRRTAGRVCRRCRDSERCWGEGSAETLRTLGSITPALVSKGTVAHGDFSPKFSAKCIQFDRFVQVANEELSTLTRRKQYQNRLTESRSLTRGQYRDLSNILHAAAEDVYAPAVYDERAEHNLARYLENREVPSVRVAVYRDETERLKADIEGPDLSTLLTDRTATLTAISALLGRTMTGPEQQKGPDGERHLYAEAEPLTAVIGIASCKKDGEAVSGDSGSYFKTESGQLCILLSDGMGSGAEAAKNSRLAVNILERMLRAGVPPEPALNVLGAAFALRAPEGTGFVTLDLLSVDLFSGMGTLCKRGAAPTYHKQGRRVDRSVSDTLPIGLGSDANPAGDHAALPGQNMLLTGGDWIIMISDGVADTQDDHWLHSLISEYQGDSPRELSAWILEEALRRRGAADDMTVLALRLKTRIAMAKTA
jgi:stage II sporulation protein E